MEFAKRITELISVYMPILRILLFVNCVIMDTLSVPTRKNVLDALTTEISSDADSAKLIELTIQLLSVLNVLTT